MKVIHWYNEIADGLWQNMGSGAIHWTGVTCEILTSTTDMKVKTGKRYVQFGGLAQKVNQN